MNAEQGLKETPLESWKEIAAYLQRNNATVRRWEKEEGLPIHRHSHKSRSSVYAYPGEIDAWRAARRVVAEPAPEPTRPWWRPMAISATTLLCLVMVGNGVHPQAASAQALTARQIALDATASSGAWSFSPDGRWFAAVEYTGATNELVLRDIVTGQRRVLTTGVCYRVPCAEADLPLLSPDLKQVAYNWYDSALQKHPAPNPENRSQLRVIANEPGATPRALAEAYYFYASAWSLDGKSILTSVDADPGEKQIEWVRVSDGAVTVIKTVHGQIDYRLSLSPDGKYIAYAARIGGGSGRQVFVMASDGSNETVLTRGAATNESPSWAPDGRHILYTSNQSGLFDLMAIEVRDGKAFGIPSIVKRGIGEIEAFGTTTSGSFLYAARRRDNFLTIAEAGELNSDLPLRAVDKFAASSPPGWSPDGKFVAYTRTRPGPSSLFSVVVRALSTGEERVYSREGIRNGPPNWSRDQKSLILPVGDAKGNTSFQRLDLATGQFKQIVPGDPLFGFFARLSPDDRMLFIKLNDVKNSAFSVVAYDLKTGQRKTAFSSTTQRSAFWFSPDGRRLAFGSEENDGTMRFGMANADGSGYREIYSAPIKDMLPGVVAWAPDLRAILLGKAESDKQARITRVAVEGGAPVSTSFRVPSNVQAIVTSPDRLHIALWSIEGESDLWAVVNVLSALN